MRFYFDTSIFIAAAIEAHPQSVPARVIFQSLIKSKHEACTSTHTLVEVYSVLTRAPFRPPVHPTEAFQLIESMIGPSTELVSLIARETKATIKGCALRGISGARVHDALHLACATKATFDRVITFNLRDFRLLADPDFQNRIIAPA